MYSALPDPHPGRCQNVRIRNRPDTSIEVVRCLDYEGVPHTCTFPPPREETSPWWWSSGYKTSPPEPWVKPKDDMHGVG